jgi:hypothetical protein
MRLTGQAELLRRMLADKDGVAMIEKSADIQDGLKAIEATLRSRQAVLFI